ncbi:hypothetical protein M1251_03730 [Staphylococcus aureus]|uniref:hypothetical protein n=1 Tax=Staphylococcus aureus TaxID=1280 RepID=UPI002DB8AEF3|nr:hypothetical protein [Staphylococcus aureus]MEB6797951.1 hypothetical protein [Staphylococcus aureus]
MQHKIYLLDTFGKGLGQYEIEIPNHCPWCKSSIRPNLLSQTQIDTSNIEWPVSFILQCPSCHKHFLQIYKVKLSKNRSILELEKDNEKPMPKNSFEYPSEINEISKEFNNIITQSSNAESLGYNHLAGIGYRKAIEFLVKDYLIVLKNEDRDSVSKRPLNQCISSIDNDRIQKLAKAATWIGNDETHYVRKHIDKDVQDLKSFLHALTSLVSLEIVISKAENFICNS